LSRHAVVDRGAARVDAEPQDMVERIDVRRCDDTLFIQHRAVTPLPHLR
jgi:hypothetical protein